MPETPGSTKYPKLTTTTRYLLVWYTSLPAAPTPAPGITCHTGSSTTYQGRIDSLFVFRGWVRGGERPPLTVIASAGRRRR